MHVRRIGVVDIADDEDGDEVCVQYRTDYSKHSTPSKNARDFMEFGIDGCIVLTNTTMADFVLYTIHQQVMRQIVLFTVLFVIIGMGEVLADAILTLIAHYSCSNSVTMMVILLEHCEMNHADACHSANKLVDVLNERCANPNRFNSWVCSTVHAFNYLSDRGLNLNPRYIAVVTRTVNEPGSTTV